MQGFVRPSAVLAATALLTLSACTVYQPVQPAPGQSWAEARAAARARETSTLFRSHRVQQGETLAGIAKRYGVASRDIAAANRLERGDRLRTGQVLAIPESGTARGGEAPSESAPSGGVRVAALPPPENEPRSSASDGLAAWLANLGLGSTARETPPPREPASAAGAATNPAPSGEQAAVASPNARLSAIAPPGDGRGSDPQRLERAQKASPPPLSGQGFLRPVAGRIISGFGDKPDGRRNDGINIAARKGTPVKAAENGIVVYVGDAIAGFGNLVLIRHAEGWTTAYAHLDAVLVDVGERVRRGQPIGRVGDTGDVKSAQLHFELRRGREPVDPRPHLVDPVLEVASR